MKKTWLIFAFAILIVFAGDFSVAAQTRTPEPQVQRDPLLEQDQLKNLDVARQYFVTRKAYRATLMRLDEIIAAYPEFSRIDEVYYLYGLSSLYLSEGKGNQKIEMSKLNDADKQRFAADKLREDAIANLNLLVEKFPNSEFKPKAKKILKQIDPKPASK